MSTEMFSKANNKSELPTLPVDIPKEVLELITDIACSYGQPRETLIAEVLSDKIRRSLPDEWMTTRYYEDCASEAERSLFCKVQHFLNEGFFSDMLFSEDSLTCKFLYGKDASNREATWSLPVQIANFEPELFSYHVIDVGPNRDGCFKPKEYSLNFSPSILDNPDRCNLAILHEMIHMTEFIVDLLPPYYHEVILYALYKDLCAKVPDLDKQLSCASIPWYYWVESKGGTHDMLFLLKSYDLDLRMGYNLGTILGY